MASLKKYKHIFKKSNKFIKVKKYEVLRKILGNLQIYI